jgi:hypothetical protein
MKLVSCRSMGFAAFRAAHAFSSRHAKRMPRRRPSSWNPVLLCWSRKKKPGARAGVPSHGSISILAWTAQFHLHFRIRGDAAARGISVRASDSRPSPADVGAAVGQPSRLRYRRILPRNEARHARARPSPDRGEQARTDAGFASRAQIHVRRTSAPRAVVRTSDTASTFAVARSIGSGKRTHSDIRFLPVTRASVSQGISARIRQQPSVRWPAPSHETLRWRPPRESGSLAESSAMTAPRYSSVRNLTAHAFAASTTVRSLELVWRARAGGSSEGIDSSPVDARPALLAPTARSAPQQAAALTALVPSNGKSAAPATALDPALMDRLTEDVIQRVERRTRIERERRGL